MNVPIKFGTDGWRAIIADTFTFENVRYAAQATADYFKTVQDKERGVFVGFDVRFESRNFARAAAEVIAANGFHVVMMDHRIHSLRFIRGAPSQIRRRDHDYG